MKFFRLPTLCLSLPTFSHSDAISNLNRGRVAAGSRCKQMVHCIMPLHFHVDKKYHMKNIIFIRMTSVELISPDPVSRANVVNFSHLSQRKYESIYDKIIFIERSDEVYRPGLTPPSGRLNN